MDAAEDSPVPWVNEHIEAYVATGGATGHRFHGATALLLTVTGRTSGVSRRTALYYIADGNRFVVVGSQGGAPTHPQWYLNVLADPQVTVQVGTDVFEATASTAAGEERRRLWELSIQNWPAYDDYAAKTDREIPVVVLTPSRR